MINNKHLLQSTMCENLLPCGASHLDNQLCVSGFRFVEITQHLLIDCSKYEMWVHVLSWLGISCLYQIFVCESIHWFGVWWQNSTWKTSWNMKRLYLVYLERKKKLNFSSRGKQCHSNTWFYQIFIHGFKSKTSISFSLFISCVKQPLAREVFPLIALFGVLIGICFSTRSLDIPFQFYLKNLFD